MMGEELNCSEVTDRGLLGDRQFAIVDRSTGKVGGAKNPRKWGNFFDFRAAYAQPLQMGAKVPAVRITLPDGAVVATAQGDLEEVLSRALDHDAARSCPGANCGAYPETARSSARTGRRVELRPGLRPTQIARSGAVKAATLATGLSYLSADTGCQVASSVHY
jgi:hypothetical protein